MKIVCIGHATYDITVPLKEYPIENTKMRVSNIVECGGGPAANAAYLLGKWDCDVSFLGIVGNDIYGQHIKKELEQAHVDTSYLEVNDNYKTPSSFIIANTSNGSRTILTHQTSENRMKKVNLKVKPDIILMDGEEYDVSVDLLEQFPSAISIMDAGRLTSTNLELCKKVHYIVCSKTFAEEVTKMQMVIEQPETLKKVFLKMKDMFHNHIIITLDDQGCLYEGENEIKLLSTIKVKAIDSTGAGDIFHGAFTYGIANHLSLEQTLKLATVTAGISVTELGSKNSIFNLNEIRKKYEEFK